VFLYVNPAVYKWVVSLDKARGTMVMQDRSSYDRYAKMKCNKRFIIVDLPNSQFILKLSASLYYSLSVNFFSEMFFFSKRGILARTLFIKYSNKIYHAEFLVLGDRQKLLPG